MITDSKIAIDPCIWTIKDDRLQLLLQRREEEPFKGQWELPGGLLKGDENAEQTLQRKVISVLGIPTHAFWQFHTFTDPKRDPRQRVASIGYNALISSSQQFKENTIWMPFEKLGKLAFDHNHIATTARKDLSAKTTPQLIRALLPEEFTLNQLQRVLEIIANTTYDNRNFRKKIIADGIITFTGKQEKNVSHRPGKLYTFLTAA